MFNFYFYGAAIYKTIEIDEAIAEIRWMVEIPIRDRLAAIELLKELIAG